jgi:hypothetical protein
MRYKTTLTRMRMLSSSGRMLTNILNPFFKPVKVFSLSKKKEIRTTESVTVIRKFIYLSLLYG